MSKKFQKEKTYNNTYQGVFFYGFLNIAKNSLNELKKRKNIGKMIWFPRKQKKPVYHLTDLGLWVAIIWNIKHAIELLIKTLGIQVDKEYLKTHDLDSLMKDLEERLEDKTRKKSINQLKKTVEKYYRCEIFAGKILIKPGIDFENDIFKYAHNKPKAKIDFRVFNNLSKKDVTAVEKDIKFLRFIFSILEVELQIIPKMKKRGDLSKSEINKLFRKK